MAVTSAWSGTAWMGPAGETPPGDFTDFITADTSWYKIAASNATTAEKAAADETLDGTDDHVQINAALAVETKVLLSSGTFTVGANKVTLTAGRTLRGQGMGATAIVGSSTVLGAVGSQSQSNDPFQNISLGATTITTKSNLTGTLSAGQRIVIRSGDYFNTLRSAYRKGEWAQIASIDATTITLEEPTRDSYTASGDGRIYGYTLVSGIEVADLTCEQTGTGTVVLADFEWCEDVTLRRVRAQSNDYAIRGIEFDKVYNGLMDQCEAYRVAHAGVSSGTQGYGLYVYGSEEVELRDCYGEGNRHSFDCDGGNFRAVSRHVHFNRCEAFDDWSAGVSTHGATSLVTLTDCKSTLCGGGFALRGSHHTAIRPVMNGTANNATAPSGKNETYHHGFQIGEGDIDGPATSNGEGVAGVGLTITDADIDFTGSVNQWSGSMSLICQDVVQGAVITGSFQGHQSYGLRFTGKTIDGLTISGPVSTGSQAKVSVAPEQAPALNVDTSGVT